MPTREVRRMAANVLRGDTVRVNVGEPGARAKHRWLRVEAIEHVVVGPEEDPEPLINLTCAGLTFTVTPDCEMLIR